MARKKREQVMTIRVMHFGDVVREYTSTDFDLIKKRYNYLNRDFDVYVQLVLDGHALTTAEAHQFLGKERPPSLQIITKKMKGERNRNAN